ncbi:MAG: CRISPR-associated endonuclease Cas1, partial [Anaerolineae bacterium CG2_30_64_16]
MATLYVTEPGSRIEKEYRHLLVTLDDKTVLRAPLASVSHVVLVGRGVGATTPALHALLAADITLSLVSRGGELLGRLTGPSGKNLELRRKQYARAADPVFCLAFARQVVAGKLANYRTYALRWRRGRPELPAEWLERLDRAAAEAPAAPDLASLRGVEGAGSKAYFAL